MEELSEVADNTPESVLTEKVIILLEKAVAEFENYQGLQNKNLEQGGYLDEAQSKIVQVITNLRNRSASDIDASAMRGVKEAKIQYEVPRMIAKSIGDSYKGGRPPERQKDLNPGEYHAFYLARRLSLTGDLKKAKSDYDGVMRNVTDENERRDFNDKLKTLKGIINPHLY